MKFLSIITLLIKLLAVWAKRAGVTHCVGESYPSTYSPSGTPSTADRAYLIQDKDYQFQCCGVVSQLNYNTGGGSVTLHIWRQKDDTDFELISLQPLTTASGSTIPENERVSFREGDHLGWLADGVGITYNPGGSGYANRYTSKNSVNSLTVTPSTYQTFAWSGEDSVLGLYDIQAVTAASDPPYFTNVPSTIIMKQVAVLVSGVLVTTLKVTDRNFDDAGGLKVRMNPDWIDVFTFDPNSWTLTTASKLRKELSPYLPVFRVEEDHCGLSTTATLTVSIVNSDPKITNLPAYADVHEDAVDETLLYTITLSDPENEAVWCKGDWTIGQEGAGTPFIVKMISTTPGSSSAGIYLIEWPKLDFDATTQYSLTVLCRDTADNEVSGIFTVNVIENQKPIFVNLDNSVEVDATNVRTGTTIFVVSTVDNDGDQVTFTSSCTPAATCPVKLFNSGHVMLKEELLFHVGASSYALEITPSDLRGSNTPRTLNIFIINISNAPVLISPNSTTAAIPVAENTATSTSIFQASATDADTGDTLKFSMTISPSIGWQLFTIDSTSGVVSTDSSNIIDYEALGASTTFSMTVMVHDGKQLVKEILTIEVTDENEPPKFVQPAFVASGKEGTAGTILQTAVNLPNMVIDPDDATWSFTLDCGSYDAYFSMDQTSGVVTYAQDYDLDATSMPRSHSCTVTATDSANNNATASYFISLAYDNDNSPVFSPSSYSVTIGTETVLGTSILKVTASDADAGTDGDFHYTLDQTSLGADTYFIIDSSGTVAVGDASLTTFAGSTQTISATATDTGGQTDTVSITVTFTDTEETTTSATTESARDFKFAEDARNIAWLSPAIITLVILLGIIIYMVITCIQERTGPISSLLTLNFKLPTLIRPRIIRESDEDAHPLPFGRQRPPVIRHIHAKDLRVAPIISKVSDPVSKPEPKKDTASSKLVSKTEKEKKESGQTTNNKNKDKLSASEIEEKAEKVSVQSDFKDDESWMDKHPTQASKSMAPTTIIAHPKSTDKDYLNPSMGNRTPKSKFTEMSSSKAVSPSPSVSIPDPIRVSPSPLSWNNTGERDDISLPESLRGPSPNWD